MTATSATPDATHLAYRHTETLSATFKNSTSFKLLYFPIHSNGATSREILSITQAKWESLVPIVSFPLVRDVEKRGFGF